MIPPYNVVTDGANDDICRNVLQYLPGHFRGDYITISDKPETTLDIQGLMRSDGFTEDQRTWMKEALYEANLAANHDDIPVGAVVVLNGKVIGRGHNRREVDNDPCAHAEMIALSQAGKAIGGWRLSDAEVYVTMEPCPMCAFALVLARVRLLVYALDDPRMGACGSYLNIAQFPGFDHVVAIRSGLYAEEAARMTREFFESLRKE